MKTTFFEAMHTLSYFKMDTLTFSYDSACIVTWLIAYIGLSEGKYVQ